VDFFLMEQTVDDPDLLTRLRELARARGVGLESLANLWLQERVLASERTAQGFRP
jgi:hypothetical protein